MAARQTTAASVPPTVHSQTFDSHTSGARDAPWPGRNVSQMHYARKGLVTPEMEYIAIRENQAREQLRERAEANGSGNGPQRCRSSASGQCLGGQYSPDDYA